MKFDPRIYGEITAQTYSLLFATISGAHLYGFPSPDSDYDLRGVHILPVREVVGLDPGRETIEVSAVRDGLEIDLVTHDVTQWGLFDKERPRRVKPLLYVYRVLLTGVHLMRGGEVEANLVKLNEDFKLPYISELIERKLAGPEKSALSDVDVEFHRREFERLRGLLEDAYRASSLPETPAGRGALNDMLIRMRLEAKATNC